MLFTALFFCFRPSNAQQCDARFSYTVNNLTVAFQNNSQNFSQSRWDFGDGSTSTQRDPVHTYQMPGEYSVSLTVVNPNGIACDSVQKRICVKCVFPGDANNDGVVNNVDVLYVGISYGAIGPVRTSVSPDSASTSAQWVGPTGPANFQAGHNFNHADCDGNGIINRHDVALIDRNYGWRSNKSSANECVDINDVPLYFEILDSIPAGTYVNVAIMLGTSQLPAWDVYGIAYTLHYSPELIQPGSVTLSYDSSLFGTPSDIIYLNKDSSQTGKLETAVCRIDHNNLTIAGRIGTAGFVMEENLAQKTMITEILNLSFSDITLVRNDETMLPVCAYQDSAVVYQKLLTSGAGASPEKKGVRLYPNPAKDLLTVEFPKSHEYRVEMSNIIGKKIVEQTTSLAKLSLDVSHLARGIYFVTLRDKDSVDSFKVEISR